MGLRAFHVVFIGASAALCLWLMGWGWAHRAQAQGTGLAGTGAAGFVALAFYLRRFLRRGQPPSNGYRPKLAVPILAATALGSSSQVFACTVCVGQSEGDVARAFQWGIAFLAVLVLGTLVGITVMMTRAIREQDARRQAEG